MTIVLESKAPPPGRSTTKHRERNPAPPRARGQKFPCMVEECDSEATKSGYCELHSHDWVAAAEVPIDNGRVAGAVRRAAVVLREETYVKVIDVYCASCRTPFGDARNTPCDSYSAVLRGGPLGTRKKRPEDEDEEQDVAATG